MSDPSDGSPVKTLKKKRRSVRFSMHASMYSFDTDSPVGIEEAPKKDVTPPKSLLKRRNTCPNMGDLTQTCEQSKGQPMTSEEKQRRINLILEQKKKTDLAGMLKASNEGRLMEYLADDLRALGLEPDRKDSPGVKNGISSPPAETPSAEPQIPADPNFKIPSSREQQELEKLPAEELLECLIKKGVPKKFLDENVEPEASELVAFATAKMLNLLPLLEGRAPAANGNAAADNCELSSSNDLSFSDVVAVPFPVTESSLNVLDSAQNGGSNPSDKSPQTSAATPSTTPSGGQGGMSPWEAVEDPSEKGCFYYWHTVTGETMWPTPKGVEVAKKAGPLRYENAASTTIVNSSLKTPAPPALVPPKEDDDVDVPPIGGGHRRKMTLEQTYSKEDVGISSSAAPPTAATAEAGDLKNMSAAQLRGLYTEITGKPATSWDAKKMCTMIQEVAPRFRTNSYSSAKSGYDPSQEIPTAYRRNYASPAPQTSTQRSSVTQASTSFCVGSTRNAPPLRDLPPQPRPSSSSVSKWEVEKSLANSASVLKSFDSVLSWIQGVLASNGENIDVKNDFEGGSILQSGIVLCKLLNVVAPGTVAKVHEVKPPVNGFFTAASKFKAQENATNFIRGCQKLGLPKNCTFDAQELTELRDIKAVLRCVENLAKLVKDTPGYTGLTL